MSRAISSRFSALATLASLVLPLAAVASLSFAPAQDGEPEGRRLPAGYCGTEACASCHEEQHGALANSVHAALLTNEGSVGCEACHGPGAAHADEFDDPTKIRHPRKLARTASETLCMSCHGEEPWVPAWFASDWYREGMSCVDCHTVHQHAAILERDRPPFPPRRGDAAAAPAAPEAPAPRAAAVESEEPEPPVAAEPLFAPPATVGSAACRACHTRACSTFADSPHAVLGGREDERPACESCHGPGSFHVEAGGVRKQILHPEKVPASVAESVCLACHDSSAPLSGWSTSEHKKSDVSCLNCHGTVGHPESPRGAGELASCGACHPDVAAEFRYPNHHRVPEGAMDCSDCHNPHRASSPINDRELKSDGCVECHAEKRGPFVYEHNADRVEGCVVCHLPHGSINRRLLTHREVRMQCLQCHSNVLPFHDQSPGSEFRNCIDCHTEIHGSHLDPRYFR